jgi:hypothetical protein
MSKKTNTASQSLIALAAHLKFAIENNDLQAIDDLHAPIEDKLQACAYVMKELNAQEDTLKDLATSYADKAASFKKRREDTRNYATACMRTAFGIEAGKPIPKEVEAKFEGVSTIWLQSNPEKLDGTLESLLEEEARMHGENGPGYIYPFIIREPKPNTDAIKAAIAAKSAPGDYKMIQDNHLRYN